MWLAPVCRAWYGFVTGLLPTVDGFVSWAAEQFLVIMLGGSPMANDIRLLMMCVASSVAVAIVVMLLDDQDSPVGTFMPLWHYCWHILRVCPACIHACVRCCEKGAHPAPAVPWCNLVCVCVCLCAGAVACASVFGILLSSDISRVTSQCCGQFACGGGSTTLTKMSGIAPREDGERQCSVAERGATTVSPLTLAWYILRIGAFIAISMLVTNMKDEDCPAMLAPSSVTPECDFADSRRTVLDAVVWVVWALMAITQRLQRVYPLFGYVRNPLYPSSHQDSKFKQEKARHRPVCHPGASLLLISARCVCLAYSRGCFRTMQADAAPPL